MLKDLAVMLEWKSIKALTVCEKSYRPPQGLANSTNSFNSGTRVILKPYVRQCINESILASLNGLYNYLAQQSPNYMFMYKCKFLILCSTAQLEGVISNFYHLLCINYLHFPTG